MNERTINSLQTDLELLKRQLWELEEAFNNSYNGISIVDKHGNIVRTNTAMQQLYQLSAREFVGKNIKDLVPRAVKAAQPFRI